MKNEGTDGNLKTTGEYKDTKIESNSDLLERARECAEVFGSTVQGVVTYREYLVSLAPEDKRSELIQSPNTTRLAIRLYNLGLGKAGIDDEILLHYHYTSAKNANQIVQDGALKAVGKKAMQQVRDAYDEGGLLHAFHAFLYADNQERVAIHVAGSTTPEEVRPNMTSIPNLINQRLRAYVGKSHRLGISSRNLECYFEIISAKSDNLFRSTFQSKVPSMDLDEQYCVFDSLSLNLKATQKYAILGPYFNPRFA